MNIETKASIGDAVYYLKRINRVTCPVCAGTGKIHIGTPIQVNTDSPDAFIESMDSQVVQSITEVLSGNVREYDCPECNGKGTVKTDGQPKYEVGKGTVLSIEATMNQGREKVIYRIADSTNTTNRTVTNKNLYLEQEAAEKQCAFMNLERRLVPLECVQIPPCFAKTIPCNVKLMKRLNEWRNHRKFETEIYVDEKLNLFDGYTSYLVYRMLSIFDIPVVIWPEDMRK